MASEDVPGSLGRLGVDIWAAEGGASPLPIQSMIGRILALLALWAPALCN